MSRFLPQKLPSSRVMNGSGLLACIAAILFAVLYLQHTLNILPCPLCVVDRVIVIGMAVIFLVAMLHNPSRLGQRLYGFSNLIISVTGIAVTSRHVWLQHLPPDKVLECGPGFSYTQDVSPLTKILKMVLEGSSECTEIQWRFLGLSLPEQTLILFVVLTGIILVQILRSSD